MHVIDLAARGRKAAGRRAPLVTGFEHDWKLVDGMGTTLWFVTNKDAPRYRLVAIDLGARQPEWRELVAQSGRDAASRRTIIGDQLVAVLPARTRSAGR